MKSYDLFGGVEEFLKKFERNAKKISSSVLALSQLNLAILPSILPSVGMVDPLNLLKTETALAEQEEALEIEVPQLVIGVASIIEVKEDKAFEVKKVESRAEKKARKAKEAATKKAKEEQAKKAREAAERAKREAAQRQATTIKLASVNITGNCADWMEKAGIADKATAYKLIMKESGCNPNAQNPRSTAYGIGQFLNSTWRGAGCVKSADPVYQLKCMQNYVFGRYGSWVNAWAHSTRTGWY